MGDEIKEFATENVKKNKLGNLMKMFRKNSEKLNNLYKWWRKS